MATSRERDQPRAEDDGEVPSLPRFDPAASSARLARFDELLTKLEQAQGLDRVAVASRLNDVLIAMREPGHETEEAELVMRALGSRALHDLVDGEGRSCRKEAVETMMACGYPHALLLESDDIAFARAYRKQARAQRGLTDDDDDDPLELWETEAQRHRRVGSGVMVAGQVLSVIGMLTVEKSAPLSSAFLPISVWTAGLAIAWALWHIRPRELNISSLGALVTLFMFYGVVVALATGSASVALAALALPFGLGISLSFYDQPSRPDSTRHWRDDEPD